MMLQWVCHNTWTSYSIYLANSTKSILTRRKEKTGKEMMRDAQLLATCERPNKGQTILSRTLIYDFVRKIANSAYFYFTEAWSRYFDPVSKCLPCNKCKWNEKGQPNCKIVWLSWHHQCGPLFFWPANLLSVDRFCYFPKQHRQTHLQYTSVLLTLSTYISKETQCIHTIQASSLGHHSNIFLLRSFSGSLTVNCCCWLLIEILSKVFSLKYSLAAPQINFT